MIDLKASRNLPTDLYDRNSKTVRFLLSWIEQLGLKRPSILDVGGADGRLLSFLPSNWSLTVLDLHKDLAGAFICADARNIPLINESFDFVVSHDFFEHLPDKDRLGVLDEMMRVAKYGAIIAAPFENNLNSLAEEKINSFYKNHAGQDHPWLREHIQNKLPKLEPVLEHLSKRRYRYLCVESCQIREWVLLQLFIFYSFIYGVKTPIVEDTYGHLNQLNLDTSRPFYRTHLVLSKNSVLPEWLAIEDKAGQRNEGSYEDKDSLNTFLETALTIFDAVAKNQKEIKIKNEELEKREDALARLNRHPVTGPIIRLLRWLKRDSTFGSPLIKGRGGPE